MKKFDNFLNENFNIKSYYNLMTIIFNENIERYRISNDPILNIMVDPLPNNPKIREFLDGLINKLGHNRIAFSLIKPKIEYIISQNPQYKQLSSVINVSEPRELVGDDIFNFLYKYRNFIYSPQNMSNIFRKLCITNLSALIAENSMISYLEKNKKIVVKTEKKDDIFKGIDITISNGTTFQVKSVLYDSNIDQEKLKDNIIYIKTSLDLSPTLNHEYDYLCFVTPSMIHMIKRSDIILKKIKNYGFELISKTPIISKHHMTDYTVKKTGTLLDDVFKL